MSWQWGRLHISPLCLCISKAIKAWRANDGKQAHDECVPSNWWVWNVLNASHLRAAGASHELLIIPKIICKSPALPCFLPCQYLFDSLVVYSASLCSLSDSFSSFSHFVHQLRLLTATCCCFFPFLPFLWLQKLQLMDTVCSQLKAGGFYHAKPNKSIRFTNESILFTSYVLNDCKS